MIVNGHWLNIEFYGDKAGTPIILLHHGLGSTRSWKRQRKILVQAGYSVIVYDRWGFGGSEVRAQFDIPDFNVDEADLLLLMEMSHTKRAILIGHSDGATIALQVAAKHPERVLSVVAVAGHAYIEAQMEVGIKGLNQAFQDSQGFRDRLRYVHGEKYKLVFNQWYEGWCKPTNMSWNLLPKLQQIHCPTWIVQGFLDEHATPDHARRIATEIPGAELWLVPGGNHMLPQEMAELFNSNLLVFLGKSYASFA